MIHGYLTVADAAERLDLSPQAVTSLCRRGHLTGAIQPGGRDWLIPESAVSARKRQKAAGKLPTGGFYAHKSNGDKGLKNPKKSVANSR